jgi:hypothetical protein
VCSQQTSVARQRLDETYFRRNEYACKNQHVVWGLLHVSWQQNNRGINCPTGCSILGPHEVGSVQDSDCVEAGSNTSTVTLRVLGDKKKKGSLEFETVKYGREYHGTRSQE